MKSFFVCVCLLILIFCRAPAGAEGASLVTINEVMASASKFRSGSGEDWVELLNSSPRHVSVAGYILSLGKSGKSFTFPAGTMIAAKGCLLIYMTNEAMNKGIVSGFPLPRSNSVLTLYDSAGITADTVTLGTQYGNISYGRTEANGEYYYLENATPGKINTGAGYAARAEMPVFSLAGGMYAHAVTVMLTAQPDTQIYYTLDGSVPGAQSRLYTKPLVFEKTAILRAAALSQTLLASAPAASTYFIGLDTAAPVVSLMTDDRYLFDSAWGVMVPGSGAKPNYEQDWEYPMQLEYFDADGKSTVNQVCGFCVSGEVSRRYSQKAMAFYARAAYGEDSFDFNPFPNREFTAYKSFTLRSAGTEGVRNGVRFRDAMLTGLALDTHTLVSDAAPVLVYLNGKLWGHYNLRERINKYCIAQHEGVTGGDTIDQIDILAANGAVKNGSAKEYIALRNYMRDNDLNLPDKLQYVLDRMDIDSYFDYAAFMMMTGSYDVSNARYYRVPGGKWKWALYDLDTAMLKADSTNPMSLFLRPKGSAFQYDFDHIPFSALMEVPSMKDLFLTRLGELMASRFTVNVLETRLDEWRQKLLPLIPLHINKWTYLSLASWNNNIEDFRKVIKARPAYVVASAKVLFHLTDEDVARYFGAFLAANAGTTNK